MAWGKGFKTEKFDDALIISGVVVLVDIKSMALEACEAIFSDAKINNIFQWQNIVLTRRKRCPLNKDREIKMKNEYQ